LAIQDKDNPTGVALPGSQVIPVGLGALSGFTTAGLNLEKLQEAKFLMDSNEVDPDERRYIAFSAKQLQDLLEVTKVTSSDFATVKALVKGEIDEFMGFTFVRLERLALDTVTGIRTCFAWYERGITLAKNLDIESRVTERDDKNYSVQPWVSQTLSAVRMTEKAVVEIPCDQTPDPV